MEQIKSQLEIQRAVELQRLKSEYVNLVRQIESTILRIKDPEIAYFEKYNDFSNQLAERPERVQAVTINCGEYSLTLSHPTERVGGYGYTISIDTDEATIFSLDISNLNKKSNSTGYNIPKLNEELTDRGFLSMLGLPNFEYFTAPKFD